MLDGDALESKRKSGSNNDKEEEKSKKEVEKWRWSTGRSKIGRKGERERKIWWRERRRGSKEGRSIWGNACLSNYFAFPCSF